MKNIKLFIGMILTATVAAFGQNSMESSIDKSLTDSIRGYNQKTFGGSAISSISGAELDKSPVSTLALSLAGRLSGLQVNESSSELTKEKALLFIRGIRSTNSGGGNPLIIVDGLISKTDYWKYVSLSDIESVSLLKDASALAIYGIEGADGAIVITTRRGANQNLKISATIENTFQQVTTQPTFINSWEYATLRNQASKNDGLSTLPFRADQIEAFKSGADRRLYPNTNWYNMFMNDIVMQQRVGVDATGGNERVKFFTSLGFINQGSQFKSGGERYDANDRSQIFRFRANLDVQLFDNLSAYYRTAGNIRRDRLPVGFSVSKIYESLFSMPSSVYGPLTDDGEVAATQNFNDPTYGILNRSGYVKNTETTTVSQMGAKLDLDFITKGLSIGGFAAYETQGLGENKSTQTFERWVRTNDYDSFDFIKKGDETNSPLTHSKPSKFSYQIVFNGHANYNRVFGKHSIDAMIYGAFHNFSAEYQHSPYLYPFKRILSGGMLNYGFDNRYLVKLDLGYSGSEQFPRGNRFHFTPAASAGWIASNEQFLKDNEILSFLKLRASYGHTANDDFGARRYAYSDEVTFAGGGLITNLQYITKEVAYANKKVEPEIIKKTNVGLDLELFKSLTINFDYFQEKIDNMYISSTGAVPSFQGILLESFPYTNSGEMENKGFELSVMYNKKVNKDLSFSLGGMLGVTKNKVLNSGEVELDETYAYRYRSQGYSYQQEWGYLVDKSNGNGFFNSQAEIDNSGLTYEIGVPRVGDLIYQDMNGDDIINEKDLAPIGDGLLPKLNYGISGMVNYKNFDFSFLLQGMGKREIIENIYKIGDSAKGFGFNESLLDGIYSEIHKNAWTAERYASGAEITYPALSTIETTNHQASDFFKNNRAYLRLKNVELGYTLDSQALKSVSIENLRFFVSGQNLLTFDSMKFNEFGPEGSYMGIPVYRMYNIGLQIKF